MLAISSRLARLRLRLIRHEKEERSVNKDVRSVRITCGSLPFRSREVDKVSAAPPRAPRRVPRQPCQYDVARAIGEVDGQICVRRKKEVASEAAPQSKSCIRRKKLFIIKSLWTTRRDCAIVCEPDDRHKRRSKQSDLMSTRGRKSALNPLCQAPGPVTAGALKSWSTRPTRPATSSSAISS